jgi:hypothetical protein
MQLLLWICLFFYLCGVESFHGYQFGLRGVLDKNSLSLKPVRSFQRCLHNSIRHMSSKPLQITRKEKFGGVRVERLTEKENRTPMQALTVGQKLKGRIISIVE